MRIGGLQRFSLIDYPARICAVIFTQGCNFRCPYCHNPELVLPELYGECVPEDFMLEFLEGRRGKLDAVTITGGEPTLQLDLPDFIRRIKSMGYLIKLDTNGSRPEVISQLVENGLLDYVAMDVKAPLNGYPGVTGTSINPDTIRQSIELIMSSGIPYEFRTTVVKSLLNERDLENISKSIKGARLYVLQGFVPAKTLDASLMVAGGYSDEELQRLKVKLEELVQSVIVR